MRCLLLAALLLAASAYRPPTHRAPRSRAAVVLDGSIVPPSVWGVPARKEQRHKLWLDLRISENTFAQQALVQLFYAVRRVVDGAGKALPQGAAVQGLLFAAERYDRADTIGADLPIFVETPAGLVNATASGSTVAVAAELLAPATSASLEEAILAFNPPGSPADSERATVEMAAIALPADPMLWAEALTGLKPSQLECVDEGA